MDTAVEIHEEEDTDQAAMLRILFWMEHSESSLGDAPRPPGRRVCALHITQNISTHLHPVIRAIRV